MNIESTVKTILNSMESYLEKEKYKGWDAHDGLNGSLLNFSCIRNRIPSMLLLQLIKNSPFNLRPILRIPKSYNPTAFTCVGTPSELKLSA